MDSTHPTLSLLLASKVTLWQPLGFRALVSVFDVMATLMKHFIVGAEDVISQCVSSVLSAKLDRGCCPPLPFLHLQTAHGNVLPGALVGRRPAVQPQDGPAQTGLGKRDQFETIENHL